MTEPPRDAAYPCPACGHQMFGELWSHEICDICYWEDDPFQLRYPHADLGSNTGLTLIEAQANYQRFGAVHEDHKRRVRPPGPDEHLDPGWRPVDPERDPYERTSSGTPHPDDLTTLYYWRPTYWRRHLAP
ncbi:CPCC family cysteine-rich protein [Streptomyces sp. NPDC098781]|uniref:CPCC family cysteine-rich protein n=1 Tax=Streptomyces sp. NPDC098781 TaxID=3366097 RepID=UPI00380944CD